MFIRAAELKKQLQEKPTNRENTVDQPRFVRTNSAPARLSKEKEVVPQEKPENVAGINIEYVNGFPMGVEEADMPRSSSPSARG